MSSGTREPLPGLLDDPHFQIDLPWNDLPIAPLRNSGTQRNANALPPLEPEAGNATTSSRGGRLAGYAVNQRPSITPRDVLQAPESRKPHLAISELVDGNDEPDTHATQLPSFVSLSVVEKSPTQHAMHLNQYAHKRRFEDVEHAHDLGRQLPRPAQREQAVPRPPPRIPAMVTGLHEPPPSANLLPSMDADHRPAPRRLGTTSKINVKDILMPTSNSRTPSPTRQLPTPNSAHKHPSLSHFDFPAHYRSSTDPTTPTTGPSTPLGAHLTATNLPSTISSTKEGNKPRRARRKWSDNETRDLLAGVRKHGVGKWKQILTDASYTFHERSAVDLKDRYRVCSKSDTDATATAITTHAHPEPRSSTPATTPAAAAAPSPASPISDAASRNASPAPSGGTAAQQQKQRRKRRAWTSEEDDALLKGVSKHGFQWTVIHDDESLQLGHRRATDLRDRIRNKYPEGYRMAEVKPLRSELKRAERGKGRDEGEGGEGDEGDDLEKARARGGSLGNGTVSGSGGGAAAAAAVPALSGSQQQQQSRKMAVVGGKGLPSAGGGGGAGVTLPSLSLDDDMDLDADDGTGIRLPPLLPWDEMTN